MKQHPPMKPAQKRSWILENHFQCSDAIAKIDAAKREAVKAYDSRLRKLHAFSEALMVKANDSAQLEMFKVDECLTPELKELLAAPLGGL